MIKRIIKVLVVLLAIPITSIEIVYYSMRWIINGEEFPEAPLVIYILYKW